MILYRKNIEYVPCRGDTSNLIVPHFSVFWGEKLLSRYIQFAKVVAAII